jgi:hypothetical protein
MEDSARVCPFCGAPPGGGVFCEACGRSLADVTQLPTRAEWEAEHLPADERTPAEATADFLDAMRAAGNPGVQKVDVAGRSSPFKRTPKVEGWVVRPVDRDDFGEGPKRYEPGLLLTVEGDWRVLDNELRGWGQRNFPQYPHTVRADPIETPEERRLLRELAALLEANGVSARS